MSLQLMMTRPSRFLALVVVLLSGAPASAQGNHPLGVSHVRGPIYRIDGAIDVILASAGPDGVLLVDGGYPETFPAVRRALRQLGSEYPRLMINTHWHHAFANESIGPSTPIVAHITVRERLGRSKIMAGREIGPMGPAGWPAVTFADSLSMFFNGERITLLHLPQAHTDGDVAVIFHGSKVLAAGDIYVPHLSWIDYDNGGNLVGLVTALDRLLEIVPQDYLVVPGHGPTGGYEDLRAFRDMLRANIADMRRKIDAGRTRSEIEREGVEWPWRMWQGGLPTALFLGSLHRGVLENRNHPALAQAQPGPPNLVFRNGRWFDGRAFANATWYSVGGALTRTPPPRVDSIIDLGGRWVIPPYGDAHTHDLNDTASVAAEVRRYLSGGVFYVMEKDPLFEIGPALLARVNRPASVDVTYVRGVVGPSWGMVAKLFETLAARNTFGPGQTVKSLDTRNLFIVDDSAALAAKWPLIAEKNPDLVKGILMFSEDLDRRQRNTDADTVPGHSRRAGLEPRVFAQLARLAHAAGRRVSAHIETAADFRYAVAAGADLIAHLPGAWQIGPNTGFPEGDLRPWKLIDADAREAARRNVTVITTIRRDPSRPQQRQFEEIHRHNLALLLKHNVRLAIGSDGTEGGATAEAATVAALGGLSNTMILNILAEATPRAVFPGRRIGRLNEGYEASFLVLDGDPIADLANLERIALRVKEGRLWPVSDTKP